MNIQVSPHTITLQINTDINAGEYNITPCEFSFTEEYDGLAKEAIFSTCSTAIKVPILNNQCVIPNEVLQNEGNVLLGVFAYETDNEELVLRYSPNPQYFCVKRGSYQEGNDPDLPSPSVWEQVLEQINEAIEETNNLNIEADKEGHITTITITHKDGTETTTQILDGEKGDKGDTGAVPNIQIGTVQTGDTSQVTRTGTNENPILNFTLQKGDTGATGNGIASITKTSTSGLVDTYTITFTNGQTTTYEITNGENGNVVDVQVDGTSVVDDGVANIVGLNEMAQTIKDVYNILPKVSGTGTTITLNNTALASMKFEYGGNTYQEDGASPSTPKTIQVVSGNNTIKVTGKNRIDFSSPPIASSNTTYSLTNDVLTVSCTSGTYRRIGYGITNIIKNNPGKELNFYYDNIDTSEQYGAVANLTIVTNGTTTYETLLTHGLVSNTYQIPNDTSGITSVIMGIYCNDSSTSRSASLTITKPMLCVGNVDTTYEPYKETSYPINLPVENLFDKSLFTYDTNWYNDNGVLQTSSNTGHSTNYILVESNTTYTISGFRTADIQNNYSTVSRIYYWDSSKNWISRSDSYQGQTQGTFTTPSNCKYITLQISLATDGDFIRTILNDLDTLQLEKGTKANQYTPYGTTPIELCEIENYQDYFSKENGNWYLYKATGKKIVNGSEKNFWRTPKKNTTNIVFTTLSGTAFADMEASTLYVNYLKYNGLVNGYNAAIDKGVGACSFVYSLGINSIYFVVPLTIASDLNSWYSWLALNNMTVLYKKQSQTFTEITYAPLLEQLEAIKKSYEGQTNITQTNNDMPFILTVETLKEFS